MTASAAHASAVVATARITAALDARGTTVLPELTGEGPLAPRRVRAHGAGAAVCLVGAMSAPLGGDRLRIETRVGAGAALRVTSAAATLALPGRTGAAAHYDVALEAADGARLGWLPEPLICAGGSELRATTRVAAAPGARVLLREEQILGRSGERPGRLATRLTLCLGGRTLLDQESGYGPGAPGWDGPAVLGAHRAVGQLLVVDPDFDGAPPPVRFAGDGGAGGEGVLVPLAGPAALATAVAPDGLRLRRLLDELAAQLTGW
ncbi:urease accessory protein UreD [Streptomyces sp. URMC 123]|uniref:urease accessory protein UreD n=1 Tax=Streptomyces sp. URMC 123 TaxID=3423403 RepID=UPI003F1E3BEB